ncbi:MAG: glycosyltransferase family 2 protein [Magnetococcales bacterium]|nr:glycosyltransferase family 2 protein [Magnetococcales bacterium]
MNSSPPHPVVSAVVVSYHTGPVLESSLRALLEAPEILEIRLVDNGNPEAVAARLDAWAAREARLVVVRPGRNLGFAAGCNRGAEGARGAYIALVNPDLIVSPGMFARLLETFRRRPDAWIGGARLLDPDGGEQRGGRRETLTPWRALVEITRLWALFPHHPYFAAFNLHRQGEERGVVEVPTLSGAFMFLPREAWHRLGGMDEGYFLHVEDIDLCLRAHKAGGTILYCGDAEARHHRGSSDASVIRVEWHKTRGLVRYFWKHFRDAYPPWVLALATIALWGRYVAALPWRLWADGARLWHRGRGEGSGRAGG